jgi:hypothetical protein
MMMWKLMLKLREMERELLGRVLTTRGQDWCRVARELLRVGGGLDDGAEFDIETCCILKHGIDVTNIRYR